MEAPLDKYGEELARCSRCGICMSVCPTYRATGDEAMAARGRLSMVEAFVDRGLGLTAGLDERISTCAGCLACESACPGGIGIHSAIMAMRQQLVSVRGSHRMARLFARQALGGGEPGAAARPLAGPGRFLLGGLMGGGNSSGNKRTRNSGARSLPGLASRPLAAMLPEVSYASSASRRVAFFPGCAVNLIYPETGLAAVRILTKAGVEVITPRGLRCCGRPFRSLGEETAARDMAEHNLRLLKALKVDNIVTACSSCALSLRKELPQLLGEDRTDVLELAERVLDIHELLDQLVRENILPRSGEGNNRRVTWHDPCHLRWGLGVSREPREIITNIPGVEYVESAAESGCCGGAGAFSIFHPGLSLKIGRPRADEIAASGARIVATGCPGCQTQLSAIFADANLDVSVVHTVELLAGTAN